MSHQSLKDLVDVTGTPTDGQVLKYTASSTSWEPADESGGGGGGAERPYFEMWDTGSTATNGDPFQGWPLYKSSSTEIIYNSLPTTRMALGSDSSAWTSTSTTFTTNFQNVYHFHGGPNSTYKYLMEIEYVAKLGSSSDVADSIHVGMQGSGSGGFFKNGTASYPWSQNGQQQTKLVSFNNYQKMTFATHANPAWNAGGSIPMYYQFVTQVDEPYETYQAGTYLYFKARWTFQPKTTLSHDNDCYAYTVVHGQLYDSAQSATYNGANRISFNHGWGTIYNPFTLVDKRVKVTQLA